MDREREPLIDVTGTADAGADLVSSGRVPARSTDQEVKTIAVAVRGRLNRVRQEMVAIGHDLLRAKALLQRGQWIPWLRAEFDMSVRAAENYMNVADRFGDQFASLANLRLETAYRLAARSTPDNVIQAVLARAASEEGLSDSDAAAMLPKVDRAPAPKPASSEVSPICPTAVVNEAPVPGHEDAPHERPDPVQGGHGTSATVKPPEPVNPPPCNRSSQQIKFATRKAFEQMKNLKPETLRHLCRALRECDPAELAMMLEKALAVKTGASS